MLELLAPKTAVYGVQYKLWRMQTMRVHGIHGFRLAGDMQSGSELLESSPGRFVLHDMIELILYRKFPSNWAIFAENTSFFL